ncbi:MAG: hypothetical protein AB4426_22695 [Xenococcaceae cyanobacterium]
MKKRIGARKIKTHVMAALISLAITFILGSLFACSIYKWLNGLSNPTTQKLAKAIKNVLGGIECFIELPSCDNYQVPQPSREDVFKAIAHLRQLKQHYSISIDMPNCPYMIIGTFEEPNRYYYLTVAKATEIMNEYQQGNSIWSIRLIVNNRNSQNRLIIKSLPIEKIVPTFVYSINQEYYIVNIP